MRAFLYRASAITEGLTFAFIGIVLGALKWEPTKVHLPLWLADFFQWCQSLSGVLLVFLFVVSYLCRMVKRFLRPPHLQKQLKALLEGLQRELFKAEMNNGEAPHDHRVTLFRKGWAWLFRAWPWSGWLIPVERSGHMHRKKGSVFRLSDNSKKVEGVAGQAWARGTVIIQDLPDLEERVEPNVQKDYFAEEKTLVNESHGQYVTLRIGKNSGRLYGIEIDVHAAKAEWVALIQKALTERAMEKRKPRRLANYEAARRLVRDRVPELAAAS